MFPEKKEHILKIAYSKGTEEDQGAVAERSTPTKDRIINLTLRVGSLLELMGELVYYWIKLNLGGRTRKQGMFFVHLAFQERFLLLKG